MKRGHAFFPRRKQLKEPYLQSLINLKVNT
jgi:hypothetical protein